LVAEQSAILSTDIVLVDLYRLLPPEGAKILLVLLFRL
jgi:hypothetical protein